MTPADPRALSETLLARALEKAANPIYIVDKGGCVVWANQAYFDLVGQPVDRVMRRMAQSLTPTRETSRFFMQLWSVVLGGETWTGELQERRPDGTVVHVDTVFTPLTDATGRPTLFLVLEHDVTTRKVEYERVRQLANHDRLTGLVNRGFFTSTLELIITQAQRSLKPAAVLFIDLDNFKKANDLFGHDKGDQVLIRTAEALRACVRKSDIVARFGGDEFACILDEVDNLESAGVVAEKIIEAIGQIELKDAAANKYVRIGASIGIAIFPNDGPDFVALIKAADMSMYAAKRNGKNCWRAMADVSDADKAAALR